MRLFFIFFLIIPSLCFAKGHRENFFLLNDGTKQNFTAATKLTCDTIFLVNNSENIFLIVDSIKHVNYYKHGRTAGPIIVGFFGGILLGASTGALLEGNGNDDYGAGFIGGAAIGILAGTIAGIAIGTKGNKIDIDLDPYNKEKRLEALRALLKN
jgi:hypothetical protein